MSNLKEILNEKVTEGNKGVVCASLFDALTDVDLNVKQDLNLVVSQLMGYPIGVFTTSAEAKMLCQQNNISDAGYMRLLCNLIVLQTVVLLNSSDVNVSDIECKLDYTVTNDIDRVVSCLSEKYNRTSGLLVKSIKDSAKSGERDVSVGEYNVSLVLVYIQQVLLKLYGYSQGVSDKFKKAIDLFNEFTELKPSVYLFGFKMPHKVKTIQDLIREVRFSVDQALEINESYTRTRIMLLSSEIGEGSLKTFDKDLYALLGRNLTRFFMEGKETTASAVFFLLKIYVNIICSPAIAEDYNSLGLEE